MVKVKVELMDITHKEYEKHFESFESNYEKKVKEMGLKKRGNYFGDTNGMIESFLECDRMKIEFQYWVEDRLKEEVERMVEEECV